MSVAVWLSVGVRLVASVRVEPQVSLPGGRVARYSTVRLSDGCEERKIDGYDDVKPLRVDRYTVTNGDFMYEHILVFILPDFSGLQNNVFFRQPGTSCLCKLFAAKLLRFPSTMAEAM